MGSEKRLGYWGGRVMHNPDGVYMDFVAKATVVQYAPDPPRPACKALDLKGFLVDQTRAAKPN